MKLVRYTQGFTLIELLVYMGLLSIFLLVLTDLLVSALDLRTSATAQTFVASDGEYLRHRLTYDIRRSSAIILPASVGVPSSQLQLTISGATFTYTLSGTNLVLTTGGSSTPLNTSNTTVASFSATRVGNGTGKDTVQVSYTLESKAVGHDGPAETKNYSLTIGAR